MTAPVRTLAGQVDASLQLAEQSGPPGFDRLVYADLAADYNAKLEGQVIAGTGASGQLAGLLTAPGTTVTYTSATPTVVATMSRIGDLAAQVSTARQLVPSLALMAPRRAFWMMSQADGQSRPFNTIDLAAPERDPNAEPVGSLSAWRSYLIRLCRPASGRSPTRTESSSPGPSTTCSSRASLG